MYLSEIGIWQVNVKEKFGEILKSDPDSSSAIIAIKTLNRVLEESISVETLQELIGVLKKSADEIKRSPDLTSPATSVISGCELYLRFITLTSALERTRDFNIVRELMLERGKIFAEKLGRCRNKIANLNGPHIDDGWKILVHAYSRTVLDALIQISTQNKRICVFVTEGLNSEGARTLKELEAHHLDVTLIPESAVGYIMESVDCAMVGAEGVVESGGVINRMGTFSIALCAKAMNKPLYVFCESFKFVRLYPLNQRDLPDEYKYDPSTLQKGNLSKETPRVDFTPPHLVTLLFTDLGILTPSAISDELIKLYL